MKYAIAIACAVTMYLAVVYVVTEKKPEPLPEPKFFEVDKSQTKTGKWILYKEDEIASKPGVKALAAPGAKKLEGLNAYVFEKDPSQVMAMSALPKGWKIQEELIHHGHFGAPKVETKCYKSAGPLVEIACDALPNPDPSPSPSPDPQPAPTPTPAPEPSKSWGVTRVHATEAKAKVDTSQVKVCVVDTGIDLQHPNNGVILGSTDFTGKGSAQDGAGHGTHTAGTIAGTGGVGVSRAKLLICKGLSDNGSGSSSGLAQCLSWCGTQGAQIVSNSWGSTQSDGMINSAINALTQKGIFVFVSAGNDSGDVNWPAKLAGTNPLVYAIAASDERDQITSFSSRGPEIRYISPGQNIISNFPGGSTRPMSGTSMSCPHAAAICAYGVARGIKPCIKTDGVIGGYPFADALKTAQ